MQLFVKLMTSYSLQSHVCVVQIQNVLVTPQRDGLATPQRELTRKNQTVRFNNAIQIEHT